MASRFSWCSVYRTVSKIMLCIPSEIKAPLSTNMKRVSKIEKMLTNVSLCVPNLRKESGAAMDVFDWIDTDIYI